MEYKMAEESSVRVALRIRPQIAREKIEMCRVCTNVTPGEPQVVLGADKAFTFDYVYDLDTEQETVYNTCVGSLLEGCFDGYNATVLAYGQTGSGKTYTMGTGFDVSSPLQSQGIIPRAVQHLFDAIEQRKRNAREDGLLEPFFQVSVQFIELYKEEILDLLDQTRNLEASRTCKSNIKIHEDHSGNIYMTGVASCPVTSAEETVNALRNGALTRTTAKTNMNAESSRSHAIFTIQLCQQRFLKQDSSAPGEDGDDSAFETLTSKFHFVDLAGSERLKRTGATGLRAEEGININCGLLALGNVISALGDTSRKATHVPYRDSKLTRLLQDSLGGNSRTTMIACISPSDCDFLETLNTLKYANRARNIKNKAVVNQDRSSRVISELRTRIRDLELELSEYKQGKRVATIDGGDAVNDMYHENTLLQTELNQLRIRVKALQESQDILRARNADILCEMEARSLGNRFTDGEGNQTENSDDHVKAMIKKYLEEIESLRVRLCESEAACELVRQQATRYKTTVQNQQRLMGGMDGFGSPNMMIIRSPNGMAVNGGLMAPGSKDGIACPAVSPLVDAAKADIERLKAKSRELNKLCGNNGQEHKEQGDVEEDEPRTGSHTDEDEESSDSESEDKEEEFGQVQQDLADLQCEISLKERLVEELVQSQKRLQAVRMQYEEKLVQLQMRIQDTEIERDRILSSLEHKQKSSEDPNAVAKVRKDYEQRLCSLRNEMKLLQVAQKEHQRRTRELQQNQLQINKLSNELQDMKRTKVLLMQKMKEEASKAREKELRRQKELAQLQKEARRRENELRELKTKEQRREVVFKRKQEEIEKLRKMQRSAFSQSHMIRSGQSDATFTTTTSSTVKKAIEKSRRRSDKVLAKLSKQHWINVEKMIMKQVVKKQTICQMEKELERLMQSRDAKRRKLEKLREKRVAVLETAESASLDKSILADIDDQIEGIQTNIDYLQDQITECQKQIMEVEDGGKDDSETQECTNVLFGDCQGDEAKYLLEHLFNFCVSQGLLAAEKDVTLKETNIKLQQSQQEFQLHRKLLQHVINNNPEACGIPETMASSMESMTGSLTVSTHRPNPVVVLEEIATDQLHTTSQLVAPDRVAREKVRRRTATPDELLYSYYESSTDLTRQHLNVLHEDADGDEENEMVKDGSRTRTCSPDDANRCNGSEQRIFGRSISCCDADQNMLMPPPLPPSRNDRQEQEDNSLGRSNAIKRRNETGSDDASTTMTISDTVVPLRTPRNAEQPSVDHQRQNGVAASFHGATSFSRGQPSRNTIAGTGEGQSNKRQYGSRNYATKGNTSGTSLRKTSQAVITATNSCAGSSSTSSIPTPTAATPVTPPASPRLLRRQFSHMNVFTRLAASAAGASSSDDTGDSDSQRHGVMYAYEPQAKGAFRNNALECVYVAEGHTKPVLSVAATDTVMATGSKDQTVKVWDLTKGKNITTLANHPNNVQCVRIDSTANMVFSVSMGHVKVWDLRSQVCVKTLSSSGLTIDGEFSPGGGLSSDTMITSSRQTTLGQNEAMIAQVELTPSGNHLMTAAYNQMRIWDLRNYSAVGKLANATSSPKAELLCMNIIPRSNGFRVAAGSRDHYIKVFNLPSSTSLNGIFEPHQQLYPPHYDGVSCLISYGDEGRWLFSGSRDQCLVKWDLSEGGQRIKQIRNAHKSWILSLTFLQPPFNNCLVSSCREGMLRLWDANKCSPIGNFLAHSSAVNCLTTNRDGFMFTGASDNTIGIWKPKDTLLSSLLGTSANS